MVWVLSATILEGTKGKGEIFVEKAFDFRHVEFGLSGICRGFSSRFICEIQKKGDAWRKFGPHQYIVKVMG